MQKPTNAKTNCKKYRASNKEIEEDHVKDGRTRLIMGIKKRRWSETAENGRRLYWKLGAQRTVVTDQKQRWRRRKKKKKRSNNKYSNNDEEKDYKKKTKNMKKNVNH
jgi:hypothetical protein